MGADRVLGTGTNVTSHIREATERPRTKAVNRERGPNSVSGAPEAKQKRIWQVIGSTNSQRSAGRTRDAVLECESDFRHLLMDPSR